LLLYSSGAFWIRYYPGFAATFPTGNEHNSSTLFKYRCSDNAFLRNSCLDAIICSTQKGIYQGLIHVMINLKRIRHLLRKM